MRIHRCGESGIQTRDNENWLKVREGRFVESDTAFESSLDKIRVACEGYPSKFGLTGEDYVAEANITCECRRVEVCLMNKNCTHKI